MMHRNSQYVQKNSGSVLVLVVVALMIMTSLGIGMLAIVYGERLQAIRQKNEMAAMLAAEAGYEKAVFWMCQQNDMLTTLYNGSDDTTGTITFTGADCDYSINFYTYVNSRPVYRIVSNGHSGAFNRTVDTLVVQAISGWAMGMCRVPSGSSTTSSTTGVNFKTGEIIDMPLHINKYSDSPDVKDIFIDGTPRFLQSVAMGESRYTTGGSDKYSSVLSCFEGGIYFNQPDSKVSDEETVQAKIDRFEDSTASAYKFTPTVSTLVSAPRYPAVQLEFFVDSNSVGKVRITNNCTVDANVNSTSTSYDYEIVPGSDSASFRKYNIYCYHYKPNSETSVTVPITATYVTQSFNGVDSEPGGQIYVKGNVVIGSSDYVNMVVKGKITVVAARQDDGTGGHIWIADAITVDGDHDANGLPTEDNPNVLGLIAQGVVKVVAPTRIVPAAVSGYTYKPIGIKKYTTDANNVRYLPHNMVVEAALIVGGGGWGAEYVAGNGGGRREYTSGIQDNIIVRGSITEACRGVVGSGSTEGYIKKYYLDRRLLEGILPGDIGLQGKYIPAPAGWHDYRSE